MSKFWHAVGHAAIIGLTAVSMYAGLVPGKYAPVAMAAAGVAQAILALVNHTPAKV